MVVTTETQKGLARLSLVDMYPIFTVLKHLEIIDDDDLLKKTIGWTYLLLENPYNFDVIKEVREALNLEISIESLLKPQIVIDILVNPGAKIVDYVTKFSGISRSIVEKASDLGIFVDFVDAQRLFDEFVDFHTVVIGHSVDCDLAALNMNHSFISDTSILFCHDRWKSGGQLRKPALRHIASSHGNMEIQNGEFFLNFQTVDSNIFETELIWGKTDKYVNTILLRELITGGHCSVEDALASGRCFACKFLDKNQSTKKKKYRVEQIPISKILRVGGANIDLSTFDFDTELSNYPSNIEINYYVSPKFLLQQVDANVNIEHIDIEESVPRVLNRIKNKTKAKSFSFINVEDILEKENDLKEVNTNSKENVNENVKENINEFIISKIFGVIDLILASLPGNSTVIISSSRPKPSEIQGNPMNAEGIATIGIKPN
eukprot:TRINITY_DN9691_c0_g1_i1.p1 TRINITY_DN9691_c0_g1~~TRINITY_DN9691_c0_g1_i1.p1  ORF type:complete len:433 (-),score=134.52 TRINITY_DN9691_c0_g1_i1:2-1300(-)